MDQLVSSRAGATAAPDADALVPAFAEAAAGQGWTEATLRRFCDAHGVSAEERVRRWPDGVRSLGRALNAWADARTLAAFEAAPAPLTTILLHRFAQNEPLKRAVLSLARSDLLHPIDTLRRTVPTASVFWSAQPSPRSRSRLVRGLRTALLVALYCVCVLVWFADAAPYRRLRRAVRLTAAVLGAR